MNGLQPDWRELESEDQRRQLEKDLRKEAKALETSAGSQALLDLQKDIALAEMRMEDSGHPLDLDKVDARLRYYRPIGVLTFLIVPSVNELSKALAYKLLMECANAGFVVGYGSAKRRWQPKPLQQSSLWTRIFNPRRALLDKSTEALGDLIFDLVAAQDGVVEEVGVDPPWKTESRLTLQMATSIAVVVDIDPSERRLEGAILDMLRTGTLIGHFEPAVSGPQRLLLGMSLNASTKDCPECMKPGGASTRLWETSSDGRSADRFTCGSRLWPSTRNAPRKESKCTASPERVHTHAIQPTRRVESRPRPP